uniref:tRNA (adenine(58)-N(1))-methyltransferase n=1 Tax=Anas platyrhynchos TaxID=8839 RepID=A0A8B9TWF1_ANAPL
MGPGPASPPARPRGSPRPRRGPATWRREGGVRRHGRAPPPPHTPLTPFTSPHRHPRAPPHPPSSPYLIGGRAPPRRGPGQAGAGGAEVGGGHVLVPQAAARRLPDSQPPVRAADGQQPPVAGREGQGGPRRRLPAARCRRRHGAPSPALPRRRSPGRVFAASACAALPADAVPGPGRAERSGPGVGRGHGGLERGAEGAEMLPPEQGAEEPSGAPRAVPPPFRAGELALVEAPRRQRAPLRALCRLAAGAALGAPGGLLLPHDSVIGRLPGEVVRLRGGGRLLVRRPSLEEYALLMPRGPAIAYPKDISAMLMMMDVHPGDTVLEAGSGSGALSLFLSRAVGPKGRVVSYETRDDHHSLAKKNYRHWRAAWEIGHMEEWPDNVDFILKDISTAAEDMKSVTFDAITLDMISPQSALSVVHPSLKQGGVCTVYLANITQVIDLLDRIRTCKLPFLCESIVEVTHRKWLVLPAKIKNCKSSQTAETQENTEEETHQKDYDEIHIQDQIDVFLTESISDDAETYCSVPYVARPSNWQDAHSGETVYSIYFFFCTRTSHVTIS